MNLRNLFLLLTINIVSAQTKPYVQSANDGRIPNVQVGSTNIKEYILTFEGYDLKIYSDACDSMGNHVLTGTITELKEAGNTRDLRVSKVMDAFLALKPNYDIIITTDRNYNLVLLAPSPGEGIARYDARLKKFIIGCDDFVVERSNDKLISYYQTLLMIVNEKLEGQTYVIPSESSCTILDFLIRDNLIHILAKSKGKTEASINKYHISIRTVNSDLSMPGEKNKEKQLLIPTSETRTPYDENVSLDISPLSNVDNAFCFLTSSISVNEDDYDHINRLYKFDGLELQEQAIANPQLANNKLNWYYTNGFARNKTGGFFFAVSKAIGPEVLLLMTDDNLNTLKSTTVITVGFTDDDRAVELTTGAILLASGTTGKFWHYTLYDTQLRSFRKIESKIPSNYTLKQLVANSDGTAKAIYYDFNKSDKKSVIIQDIIVNN